MDQPPGLAQSEEEPTLRCPRGGRPMASSSVCGFWDLVVVVRHRKAVELIDHDGLISVIQIRPVRLVETGGYLGYS